MNESQRALNQMARNFQHLADREKLEREKLVLQLENAVLRIERRLPPGKSSKESGPSKARLPARASAGVCQEIDMARCRNASQVVKWRG
jgi:hypothetical protein